LLSEALVQAREPADRRAGVESHVVEKLRDGSESPGRVGRIIRGGDDPARFIPASR
jgi:hypothetical protein